MSLLTLHKTLTLLLCMTWLSWTWSAHAANPPPAFTASYKIEKYNSTVGIMHLSLQYKDDRIIYTSHTQPKGLLDLFSDDEVLEQSILKWNTEQQQLQLVDYQYTRAEKPKDNQQFSITWNETHGATCSGISRNQPFTLQLDSPVWDRLSVQLALMADLTSDAEPKTDYHYTIIENAELSDYQFLFESKQTIKIGEQEYHTLKFKRPHDSGKRTTYLWLSVDSGFIPVRVEQHKKGKLHFSMELAEPARITP